MSVSLSVHMVQPDKSLTDFHEIWYGLYAIANQPKFLTFNFFHSVMASTLFNTLYECLCSVFDLMKSILCKFTQYAPLRNFCFSQNISTKEGNFSLLNLLCQDTITSTNTYTGKKQKVCPYYKSLFHQIVIEHGLLISLACGQHTWPPSVYNCSFVPGLLHGTSRNIHRRALTPHQH